MEKKINLKKLILKKEISLLLAEVAGEIGCPLQVRDREGEVLFRQGDQSFFLVEAQPVYLNGEAIGYVYSEKGSAAVARLLSQLATNEVEKKALGREALAKYKEINLLYEITEKLAESFDPRQVAMLVIEEAGRLVKASYLCLKLREESGGLARLAWAGECSWVGGVIGLLLEEVEVNVLKTGRPEILNGLPSETGNFSLMCVPLKVKERVIGVITLTSSRPVNYNAEDLKLVSALAFQAAAVIENAMLYDSLKETFLTTVDTLAETIDKRDPYTGGHTRRVMKYCLAIGRELGLVEADLERLKLAAILHDIGKIGIGDNILLKNGKLSREEFEVVKMHPLYAEEILKHIKHLKDIIPGVKHHHERFNGGGYPSGLKGKDIDIVARIIAVADAFDAMTSERRYRKALSPEEAVGELKANAGTQFDPVVVEAFLRVYQSGKIV